MLTAVDGCRLNGGELFDYVVEKDFLEESEAVYYMKQILEGLDFCHKRNIVHLDLKVCESVTLEPRASRSHYLMSANFNTHTHTHTPYTHTHTHTHTHTAREYCTEGERC